MSLLLKCKSCQRESVGGNTETGICHRCRDGKVVEVKKPKSKKVIKKVKK